MKRKLIKWLIRALSLTLIVTSLLTFKAYKNAQSRTIKQEINNPMNLEQTYKVIDTRVIVDSLKAVNSNNCLSGDITIQAKFTDKNISDNDVNFKWLKDILEDMTSNELTVDSTFDFMFAYDLSNPQIDTNDNSIIIKISPNKLSLVKCELLLTNSLKDDIGLFRRRFSPSELASINKRTRDMAYNRILSYSKLRTEAVENLKNNIRSYIQPLVGSEVKIDFEEPNFDVIEQNSDSDIMRYTINY